MPLPDNMTDGGLVEIEVDSLEQVPIISFAFKQEQYACIDHKAWASCFRITEEDVAKLKESLKSLGGSLKWDEVPGIYFVEVWGTDAMIDKEKTLIDAEDRLTTFKRTHDLI